MKPLFLISVLAFFSSVDTFAITGKLLEKKDIPKSTCALYAKNVQVDLGRPTLDHFFCSATIVSPLQAITAAHCDEEIIATSLRQHYPKLTYSGVELRCFDQKGILIKSDVKNFIRHPEYRNSESGNDIAVINLKSPMPAQFAGVLLNESVKLDHRNLSSSNCSIAGYGSEEDDLDTLNAAKINETIYGFYEDSGSFVSGEGFAEPGDSGGFFGCQVNGENLLIGVITQQWDESVTSVEYVYHYREWLKSKLKSQN